MTVDSVFIFFGTIETIFQKKHICTSFYLLPITDSFWNVARKMKKMFNSFKWYLQQKRGFELYIAVPSH